MPQDAYQHPAIDSVTLPEVLHALSDPLRLSIVTALREGGARGWGEFDSPVAASTLSHHLKRLVDAGLLTSRAEGTYHYYAADHAVLRKLTSYLWEDCCKRGGGSCC